MKKEISALALAAVLMVPANASAVELIVPDFAMNTVYAARSPRYADASSISLGLTVSGSSADYSLNVVGNKNVQKISATLQLQKKNSNGTYTNYSTSSSASNSKSYLSTSGSKTVASGGTYRIKATITLYNSSGSSTETVYSYA